MPTVSGELHRPPESVALLAQRTRVGLWLSLTSITLFALVDPFVNRHVLGLLYAIKAVQVAVAIALFRALRRTTTRRTVVAAALVAVTVFSVSTAMSGSVTEDAGTTPVLLVVLSMGTSTLLPWGMGPQLAVQVVVVGSILWNLWAVHGPPVDTSLPIALAVASCVSVYAAYAAERYQRERQRADTAGEGPRRRPH